VNRESVIMERKCFIYRGFGHIAYNYRNVENRQREGLTQKPLNKFEVLKSRVMNVGEGNRGEIKKNRKKILREKNRVETGR